MNEKTTKDEVHLSQFRLFLEELCCDLCRFEHVERDGLSPEQVNIDREVFLGVPGVYSDIRVTIPNRPSYFVEVKFGHSRPTLVQSLRRKFGTQTPALRGASKVIVLVDTEVCLDLPGLQAELAPTLASGLKLEVWDLQQLAALVRERFHVDIDTITHDNLIDLRNTISQAKGFQAFGGTSIADFSMDGLQATLLWHFGFWRLQQLREQQNRSPREIIPPGEYKAVVILLADLCSFSSYVRDTPNDDVIRDALTSFYSKARYQIINSGGMLMQFIGDEAVGLFGIPDQKAGYVQAALDSALALVDIGNAVSNHWQRSIDRVQKSGGVHIGIAIGDLHAVSMQPFGRAPIGVIGDSINLAARLMATAGPNEIIVSNAFFRQLDDKVAAGFREVEPLDLHNVGRINAWKISAESRGLPQPSAES
jgi:adenylate cyclase